MTIKKSYLELVSFLESNKNKKVSSILDEVKEMTKQKSNSKTFLLDQKGNVIAIFCYYHKQWELLEDVPYGKKASSTTGYNTMCKIGVSKWTKQNKNVKEVGTKILEMLESEELDPKDISSTKEKMIEDARVIDIDDMPIGVQTIEELEL